MDSDLHQKTKDRFKGELLPVVPAIGYSADSRGDVGSVLAATKWNQRI